MMFECYTTPFLRKWRELYEGDLDSGVTYGLMTLRGTRIMLAQINGELARRIPQRGHLWIHSHDTRPRPTHYQRNADRSFIDAFWP
jgi:hypothetical protein